MAESDVRDVLTALSAAGVRYVVVGAHALAAHGHVPDRIHVHTQIVGVDFERAWAESVPAKIADVEVPVLGLSRLIAAKQASVHHREPGSAKELQDRADLAWLLVEERRRQE